ncbi:unnamed protein product [Dracunculus medinensis]|uniref:Dimer_Tnp_hAT domain-containing protein n=1 Tax=Dracunculus medinensis TaxID=318479 RepID=A0A0N4UEG4_DRAME|nr:unnamed protein product [Dracunculus medinensis]
MSLTAAVSEAPEPKKFRLTIPTQVVVQRPDFGYCNGSPVGDAANGGQSPAAPSSTCSSSPIVVSTKDIKDETNTNDVEDRIVADNSQNFVDVLSTAMMFQANALFKSNLVFMQQQQQQSQTANVKNSRGSKATTPTESNKPKKTANGAIIPGALAAAASPAAALFGEDDWSWHRNPAAAIRSGGTNKQTPVWKYFVYNKLENLSRCIVGDCTYMLKGPHTSTLACHLKKHPIEYAEFQKLKLEYTRDRNGGQLPNSPDSQAQGSNNINSTNRTKLSNYAVKNNKLNDTSSSTSSSASNTSAVINLCKNSRTKSSNNNASNIFNLLNARANAAALISANAHLSQSPFNALFANDIGNAEKIGINPFLKNVPNLLTASLLSTKNNTNCRKWGREDRRQKEIETKLALMLSATHLPTALIENTFFREFLEFIQPKFCVPTDVNYIEELINTQYSRTLINLKNQLSIAKRITIMIDVLKLPSPSTSLASADNQDEGDIDNHYSQDSEISFGTCSSRLAVRNDDQIIRLCVSAAYFNPLTQLLDVGLLGVRPLLSCETLLKSVRITVEQLLSDFDIGSEKVSRYLMNGINELIGDEFGPAEIFPNSLEPYNRKLAQSLVSIIDTNAAIDDLKKSFYIETILEVKDAFLAVCAHISSENPFLISNEQWQMLEGVSRLLRLFRTHMNVIQGDNHATIDGVFPSLMQLQFSLKKDFPLLNDLTEQLRCDLRTRTAFMLDINSENFDGSFIQATALNPNFVNLLDDEQLAYSKKAIISEVLPLIIVLNQS